MFVSTIIVAAGKGTRLNSKVSKQFLTLNGKPILAHTLDAFERCKLVNEIIIVTGAQSMDYCQEHIVNRYSYTKIKKIIAGGDNRQMSVYEGLKAVNPKTDIVLVHDGVRPFIEEVHIRAVIQGVKEGNCCILGVKSKDTIKICNENGVIQETPNRDNLWLIQTPQGFTYDILRNAHQSAVENGFTGTDDASLAERMGYDVKVVPGSYSNIKITTEDDLLYGKLLLDMKPMALHPHQE